MDANADIAIQLQQVQTAAELERRQEANGVEEEEEVQEVDPGGRYQRYKEIVARGRLKVVYRAFDKHLGLDIAWIKVPFSKIQAQCQIQDPSCIAVVVSQLKKGLFLDHPNIIKCFKCWEDPADHTINLITELFTSGTLRQYRRLHKSLDQKALKRMARHVLLGLQYLHSQDPPVFHGDLRCDKIYVNGHSGEIRVGDFWGLSNLLSRSAASAEPAQQVEQAAEQDPAANGAAADMAGKLRRDITDFGLCVLELLTLERLESAQWSEWPQHVQEKVQDPLACEFVSMCLQSSDPDKELVTADQLLDHPWLLVKRTAAIPSKPGPSNNDGSRVLEVQPGSEADEAFQQVATGQLRGEDYKFQLQGRMKDGIMAFRMTMQQSPEDEDDSIEQTLIRTIDFDYDPEIDTVDSIAYEIGQEFELSTTDTEICAAVLKEFLAKQSHENFSC